MARSSILGTEQAPTIAPGRGADLLGPSDSSDSGSDIQGELHLETGDDFESRAAAISGAGSTDPLSDSDTGGTGERASAVPEHPIDGADIGPDRIILSAEEALDSDPELVSIDDPQGVDIANLAQDEEDSEEDPEEENPEDPRLTSGSTRSSRAGT